MAVNIWRFYVSGNENIENVVQMNRREYPTLFSKAEGYLSTEVKQNIDDCGIIVVYDGWRTKSAFDAFREKFNQEFKELNKEHKKYYARAEVIGFFAPL